ncbi:MAG: DUF4258 domain-containing protein [Acidobacteria bacterium]|nr:DUF4258 domain-containing protein [Acidobacteriota bacterium]
MKIKILRHARQRMEAYNVEERLVEETLRKPDSEVPGGAGRCIAQKRLNGYVLRVIYEKEHNAKVVITVYKAKRERYQV